MAGLMTSLMLFAVEMGPSISSDALTTGLIGLGTGGGFSVWLARHLVVNVIPEMQKAQAATIDAMQIRHAADLDKRDAMLDKMQGETKASVEKISNDFRTELREMRASHKTDLVAMWTESKETSRLMVAALNNLTTELRQVDKTMQQGSGPSGLLSPPTLKDSAQ